MNIVVTLNENYLRPLCVMLRSFLDVHTHLDTQVYVLHTRLTPEHFAFIESTLGQGRYTLHNVQIDDSLLCNAPVHFHFTREMYYRIFAAQVLPAHLDRALYLDPDIVVLAPLDALYSSALEGRFFAAARNLNPVGALFSKMRLGLSPRAGYFNSGVLLMNLAALRAQQDVNAALAYIEKTRKRLLMPDQDVLNALYGTRTLLLNPLVYNFDARYYAFLHAKSLGKISLEHLPTQTCIVHYCGKQKPWKKSYRGQIGILYRMNALRTFPPKEIIHEE